MKGVVFTEFLEMVEQKFGMDMVNDLIDGQQNNTMTSSTTTPSVLEGCTPRWARTTTQRWSRW